MPNEARFLYRNGFSYPVQVMRVGDVTASSCTHHAQIDAHCLGWCQDWSLQSWGRHSHTGVQGLHQYI